MRPSRSRAYESVRNLLAYAIATPYSKDAIFIRREAAKALIDLVQEDYIIKGLGGTDSAGIQWDLTKRFESDGPYMMVLTGKLLKSLNYRLTSTGFELYFDTPYAQYALAKRPAWPDGHTPPASYLQVVQEAIKKALSQVIETRLRERFRVETGVS